MHPFRAPHDVVLAGRRASAKRGWSSRAMRGALLATALPLSWGCLVDEPPEFHDPEQTAPILYLDQSLPRNTTFLPATSNSTIQFSVMIQSNDLGDNIVAYPWLNLGLQGETALTTQRIAPGVFETPRNATFPVVIPSGHEGCAPLTILFFHEDDYDPFNFGRPRQGAPVSRATWWLLIDADPEDVTFADCPQLPNQTPPQQ